MLILTSYKYFPAAIIFVGLITLVIVFGLIGMSVNPPTSVNELNFTEVDIPLTSSSLVSEVKLTVPELWIETHQWITSEGVDYSCNQTGDICSIINVKSPTKFNDKESGFTVLLYDKSVYKNVNSILNGEVQTLMLGNKQVQTDGEVVDHLELPGGTDPANWNNPVVWYVTYVFEDVKLPNSYIVVKCGSELQAKDETELVCTTALESLAIN